jgi:hypothetical protein
MTDQAPGSNAVFYLLTFLRPTIVQTDQETFIFFFTDFDIRDLVARSIVRRSVMNNNHVEYGVTTEWRILGLPVGMKDSREFPHI